MSIKSRIAAWLNPPQANNLPGNWIEYMTGTGSYAGIITSEAGAMNVSAVYCAVNLISDSIKSMPLILYRRDEDGKTREEGHPAHMIVKRRPNPYTTPSRFKKQLQLWSLLWGNGYAEIERSNGGKPVALWLIHPSRVKPEVQKSGNTRWKVANDSGTFTYIDDANMLHIMGPSTDGVVGMSIISRARDSFGLAAAAELYGRRFFSNSAIPSGVLEHPGPLRDKSRENLRRSWEKMHSGENQGKIAILEEGMKFQNISMPSKDAQFLETRQFQVVEIARWFNVPPHKLKDLERATFCLPAGTSVFTTNGPKPIEAIKAGESVWSYDGSQIVSANVVASALSGIDSIKRIVARNAVLRCSPGHRVLVRRAELAPVSGKGGYVTDSDGRKWRKSWAEKYVRADEIQPGDKLVMPRGVPDQNGTCPGGYTPSIELAETIGHHLGDGFHWTLNNGQYPGGIGFSHGENESSRGYYAMAMEKAFPERSDFYDRDAITTKPVESKRRDKNTTCLYSVAAYTQLQELGVLGKAHTKRLPTWIYSMPRAFRVGVLRGYLDSDGTINKRGGAKFCSVSKNLIDDFRHLAIGLGYRVSNIYRSETDDTFGNSSHVLFSFCVADYVDVQNIGTHKPEYALRTENAIARQKGKRAVPVYKHERAARGLDATGVRYLTIVDIVDEPAEPVYDLSVEGTHSFVADGVIVHNSNIEEQNIEYVQDCIMPLAIDFEEECNRKLLMFEEQNDLFFEFLADGLLRANISTRYAAYAVARQWGWMSANDILRKENMNTLEGDQGDIYLVPMNMVPADRVDDMVDSQTSNASTYTPQTPAPESDDGNGSGEDESSPDANKPDVPKIAQAFAPVFADVYGRMLTKEAKAAERAAKNEATFGTWIDKFYTDHELLVRDALIPACEACAAACVAASGHDLTPEQVADSTRALAQIHVRQSKHALRTNSDAASEDSWQARSEDLAALSINEFVSMVTL